MAVLVAALAGGTKVWQRVRAQKHSQTRNWVNFKNNKNDKNWGFEN